MTDYKLQAKIFGEHPADILQSLEDLTHFVSQYAATFSEYHYIKPEQLPLRVHLQTENLHTETTAFLGIREEGTGPFPMPEKTFQIGQALHHITTGHPYLVRARLRSGEPPEMYYLLISVMDDHMLTTDGPSLITANSFEDIWKRLCEITSKQYMFDHGDQMFIDLNSRGHGKLHMSDAISIVREAESDEGIGKDTIPF
jgi:hypothetical protein